MCGCQGRRDALNDRVPGLGDAVATVAEPIKRGYEAVLRPDPMAVFWLLVGAFVAPYVITHIRARL